MKLAIIADIHSNLTALKAVLADMPHVDEIICVGDLVGYAAEPNEVIELVKSKGMRSVMGNHDYAAITRDVRNFNPIAAEAAFWTGKNLSKANLTYLRSLPTKLRLTREKKTIFIVHGSPRDPLFEYVFPDSPNQILLELVRDVEADVIIFGHTHIPIQRIVYGKLIINPGGVGQPRDRDPRASYMVLTLNDEIKVEQKRVKYDIDETARKIKSAGLPSELAVRLYFGW